MGLFSGCPAIWELADPRSTLRQVGGTVEILVRTATLATFRDEGFTAPLALAAQSGRCWQALGDRAGVIRENSRVPDDPVGIPAGRFPEWGRLGGP